MRWFVLVSMVALAGCMDSPQVEYADDGTAENYIFVLYGESATRDEARHVDMRIFYNGELVKIAGYDAEPGAKRQALAAYNLPAGAVTVDVVADGSVVQTAFLQTQECPSGYLDAVVEVHDRVIQRGDRSVSVDYGCSK